MVEYKKLNEIATIINGYAFKSSKYITNGYRVIRITNVQKGFLCDDDPKYYAQEKSLSKYELFEKDILISLTGNVGRVGFVEKDILPAYLNQRVGCIRINSETILPRYLFHFLNNDLFEQMCIKEAKGIAQLNLSTEWLKNVRVRVPSLEDQQRIVNILDKAEEIRTKKKLANEKLDEFLKSTFIDMFGDPVTNPKDFPTQKLNDIATLKNGINFLKGDSGFEVKCLGVSNFKDNNFIVDSTNFNVVEVSNKPSEDYYLKKNDIVFVRSNGSKELVGRTVLIKTEGKIVFSGFCIRCRLTSNMNPIYLLMLLKTESMKNAFSHDGHGCNIKSLNQQMLGNLDIIISPLELQNQFAQIVHKVEAQKEKNQKVIEQMDNLFNSLMQQAFNYK